MIPVAWAAMASTNNRSPLVNPTNLLLGLLLLLSLLRLTGFIMRFAGESLQMDFAAFYTAGEALNAGLSPYRTHLEHEPPLWDGVNNFLTSRFLYPPLVATLFQPWALLDYATAKVLWMLLSLGCLVGSILLVGRRFVLPQQRTMILLFGLLAANYFPLLTYLERGQIDAINLLLLTLAILLLLSTQRWQQVGAGLLIALATLFKLQCIYFVPFLFWRRLWWAVVGYGIGGVALLMLSLWLNGATALSTYLQVELPRISAYGDLGPPDQWMDRSDWQALHAGVPEGYTIKDGQTYLPESFFFTKNATAVRNLHSVWQKTLGPIEQSTVSLVVFGVTFGLLLLWERTLPNRALKWTRERHFFYWQIILLVILLTGPMTWIMNLIWLLPLTLALMTQTSRVTTVGPSIALGVALFAIVITALPDIHASPLLVPFASESLRWHYVFAELLLLVALLGYLRQLPKEPHHV